MEGFSIRQAKLADAERIYALIGRNADNLVPRSLANIVESIDRFAIAEADGEMAGCAAYQIHPEIGAPESATVEIVSVAVKTGFRRRGIGRAAAFSPRELVVLTFAPEFFASLGFAEVPKTKIMHKLYTGCMNCTKHADPFTCPEKAMIRQVRERNL